MTPRTYTTFPNESILYRHPNGETLVKADTATGRAFVAVDRHGFRTDYPVFDGKVTRWDNPEFFTHGFVHRVSEIVAGKMPRYVNTTWELRTYDVWGNARDGYDVNNVFSAGSVAIRCRIEVNNPGTPQEFLSAYPSDSQIRRAFNLRRFKLDTDGDDLTIYVNRERDGYPVGEMRCTSHESLSPIRKAE